MTCDHVFWFITIQNKSPQYGACASNNVCLPVICGLFSNEEQQGIIWSATNLLQFKVLLRSATFANYLSHGSSPSSPSGSICEGCSCSRFHWLRAFSDPSWKIQGEVKVREIFIKLEMKWIQNFNFCHVSFFLRRWTYFYWKFQLCWMSGVCQSNLWRMLKFWKIESETKVRWITGYWMLAEDGV